ncbi:MAG: homoaconitate hydratase [Bacteroidetes bacterium GWE2_41_25]|nr:MAG: homoaconitate hydratase [Bacteroidetes bacterium GWA2_40_15]OFX92795.1 MAG: homoaconitate hydratase [Bacteroidetes bacterium GWC2_40_22]OFX92858.1 MAG: homoaconitate hydratase [Bacteroidetes bacterium GWE2_41_25]HBQ83837.1 homoaconitate hydratase [Bacteroidales bacterium]HCU18883.1 homoaconitate hydratase [Bacteroidales bacterium]
MAMTLIEKILAAHSKKIVVTPGDIIDVEIDCRVARDFGGANVVKNLTDNGLNINDINKTLFTFDCNPTGSDQKYAVNQHICRLFARQNGIRVYDIDAGIGTHILIDEGYVFPGATAVSTDSHANILGAIGAFGQGMGDMDIAAAWHKGKVWFKVPPSVKIYFEGNVPAIVTSKDFVLNLLRLFGANSLLGYSIELYGDCIGGMSLDDRITISSMATEMGAIIILFPPSDGIISYCSGHSKTGFIALFADPDAHYEKIFNIDVTEFRPLVSRPGEPHDTVDVSEVYGVKIDSAFIGSCTNGRMTDLEKASIILKNRKIAPGVVLKIVPATDAIWNECLEKGIIDIFKKAGALVSNAGCAGCAAGQVGQNGPGEVTVSTGNRNFPGKQGKGSVYLASPDIVAASAVAGFITTPDKIPAEPSLFLKQEKTEFSTKKELTNSDKEERESIIEGKIWLVPGDNIDTDMIFHNRYLSVTDIKEMGQYTFDNLKGFETFARNASPGDIVITGKNFGCGSSRQQAVDCFYSLGIKAIIAESFGAIYERNAINAAFPVIVCKSLQEMNLNDGDIIRINLKTGEMINIRTGSVHSADPFTDVQYEIYQKGGLLG